MSGIEQLKRRVDTLAPAPKEYRKSAWEQMTPEEKRVDVRKWIKVWTDHYPDDKLPEAETEIMITKIIKNVDGGRWTGSQKAAAQMSDAEIESRTREILSRAREP